MADTGKNPRLDRVEQILAELAANSQKEAEKNDRRAEENDRRAEENDRRVKENDRLIEELQQSSKSVDRQLKRLGRQIGGADNRWGKIIEDLVAGDLITIARDYLGLKILYVSTRVFPEDRSWEVDVLGTDTDAVVVTEVKTTLNKKDIDKFLANTLLPFTRLATKHQHKRVYGIIAYVKVARDKENEVLDYAWSKGLLVVKAMDGTNRVIENKDFKPRDFCSHRI